jgi:hypothetical protein
MDNLMDIHTIAQTELSKRFNLEPVKLKHPFPERPIRALGLMKIDGEVFSRAACQVQIPEELDEQAACVFKKYLNLFCDVVDNAQTVSGKELKQTRKVFEDYLETLVDHDPGVGVWKILFGKKGGVERSMDMHFGR